MNSSLEDLQEIFSKPPTEARYSWVINQNGSNRLEGTTSRIFNRKYENSRDEEFTADQNCNPSLRYTSKLPNPQSASQHNKQQPSTIKPDYYQQQYQQDQQLPARPPAPSRTVSNSSMRSTRSTHSPITSPSTRRKLQESVKTNRLQKHSDVDVANTNLPSGSSVLSQKSLTPSPRSIPSRRSNQVPQSPRQIYNHIGPQNEENQDDSFSSPGITPRMSLPNTQIDVTSIHGRVKESSRHNNQYTQDESKSTIKRNNGYSLYQNENSTNKNNSNNHNLDNSSHNNDNYNRQEARHSIESKMRPSIKKRVSFSDAEEHIDSLPPRSPSSIRKLHSAISNTSRQAQQTEDNQTNNGVGSHLESPRTGLLRSPSPPFSSKTNNIIVDEAQNRREITEIDTQNTDAPKDGLQPDNVFEHEPRMENNTIIEDNRRNVCINSSNEEKLHSENQVKNEINVCQEGDYADDDDDDDDDDETPRFSKEHRIFGERYIQTKSYINYLRSPLTSPVFNKNNVNKYFPVGNPNNSSNDSINTSGNNLDNKVTTIAELHFTNMRLQEELSSANKKIQKLNRINSNALKKKGELQQEVLEAYKKITDLEVEKNVMKNKQRDMLVEMKSAKQRVGEAERDAAASLANCAKLERALQECESKKDKYFEDLSHAERRISKLESLMEEVSEEKKIEIEAKHEAQRKLYETESALKYSEVEIKKLKDRNELYAMETKMNENRINREQLEKGSYENRISELTKQSGVLKDDIRRLEYKYEVVQKNLDKSKEKLTSQRERHEMTASNRTNLEQELRNMHRQLSKERIQQHTMSTEHKIMAEKLRELRKTNDATNRQNEEMRKENRNLKDKLLYLELSQKICDSKSIGYNNSRSTLKDRNEKRGETQSSHTRKNYLYEAMAQIKAKRSESMRSESMRSEYASATFTGLRDENNIDRKMYERMLQPSREHSASRGNSLGKLNDKSSDLNDGTSKSSDIYDINSKITQLQREQKIVHHVTAESISRSNSTVTAANRAAITDNINNAGNNIDPQTVLNTGEDNGIAHGVLTKERADSQGAYSVYSILSGMDEDADDIPSFGDELKSEDEMEVDNMVNFSDLLDDNQNKDLANALL